MATKIMLVEDDTNLSSIYQARLEAEGFQIITANDGEAALALAVKEHPELIISDVMMPKISGFDMLDILRQTDGIKNTKVIMMTALGQAEDKARADKLGADRYLVKSQVTLEDVVRTVHEVLEGQTTMPGLAQPESSVTTAAPQPAPVATTEPQSSTPETTPPANESVTPTVANVPMSEPVQAPSVATTSMASPPAPQPVTQPIAVSQPPAEPSSSTAPDLTTPEPPMASPVSPSLIPNQPQPQVATTPLVANPSSSDQLSVPPAAPATPAPTVSDTSLPPEQTTKDEQAKVLSQIEDFLNNQESTASEQPTSSAPPTEPTIPTPSSEQPTPETESDNPSKKVIEPIVNSNPKPSLSELLSKESSTTNTSNGSPSQSTDGFISPPNAGNHTAGSIIQPSSLNTAQDPSKISL